MPASCGGEGAARPAHPTLAPRAKNPNTRQAPVAEGEDVLRGRLLLENETPPLARHRSPRHLTATEPACFKVVNVAVVLVETEEALLFKRVELVKLVVAHGDGVGVAVHRLNHVEPLGVEVRTHGRMLAGTLDAGVVEIVAQGRHGSGTVV